MAAQITASMVKELRDRTGVGMAKCKEALNESKGDMDLAIAHLRKTGMASAVKKESREAKEGLIITQENEKYIALVEINAETDFVVKNENFQKFSRNIASEILNANPRDVETFKKQPYSQDSSMDIDGYRASIVQSLGENVQIKRFLCLPKEECSLGVYSHMEGKIVALIFLEGNSEANDLAKDIAMHVAAEAPDYISPEEVPSEVKSHEEDIAKTQALSSGKPQHIIDKIVEGKLNAYYDQTCLLRQKFVKDGELSIDELLKKYAKENGSLLNVKRFVRWKVGN